MKRSRYFDRRTVTMDDCSMSFFKHLLETAQSPVAEVLASYVDNGDFLSLVNFDVDPNCYTDAHAFKVDYLLANVASKLPTLPINIDREKVALDAFRDSEVRCGNVNRDIQALASGRKGTAATAAVLFAARRKIHQLLGDLDWNEVASGFAWGPGASTSKSRRRADAFHKFGDNTDASHNLAILVDPLLKWLDLWKPTVRWVPGSKGTTVPKSAKTDRFIAIEPDLNLMVQKGIGGVIRRRLRRVGLLTPNAQVLNALDAKEGSLTGKLATIDLKAASDSIPLGLVEELLPEDWVLAIKLSRSPICTLPDGDVVVLQKVSSMGNGFTFELETLIFWALAYAYLSNIGASERHVRVYGDDIIMPSLHVPGFIEVLADLGFIVNESKSFHTGPFRESCGKHYFRGIDVTPFFMRRPVDSIDRYYWLANSIKLWSRIDDYYLDERWLPCYQYVHARIPERFQKIAIPLSAGSDTGLFMNLDEAVQYDLIRDREVGRGWRYHSLTSESKVRNVGGHQRLLKSLFMLEGRDGVQTHRSSNSLLPFDLWTRDYIPDGLKSGGGISVSTGRLVLRKKRTFVPQWRNVGTWI